MTGLWSLIVPEATENHVPNPSLEVDATGYTNHATGAAAGTRARSADWQKRDVYSYKLVKSGGGASDQWGFSMACNDPGDFVLDDDVTFSVDLNVAASTTVTIEIEATVGGSPESATLQVTGAVIGRYEVTHTLTGTATAITAYVYIDSATGTAYADGLQVEEKTTATTYCDGTRDGCAWKGAPHGSSSTRDALTRAGGRERNLDFYDYAVLTYLQIGTPPDRHLVLQQAQLPGDIYRGHKVQSRPLVLELQNDTATTREQLHSKRKALWDAIKPDLIPVEEPVIMYYHGANDDKPIQIAAYYDSGFEFGPVDGFTEIAPVRFVAYDPFWYEDGEAADSLTTSDTVSADYIFARVDGVLTNLSGGLEDLPNVIRQGPDGKIYVGGNFADADSVANTLAIAAWDPVTLAWEEVGGGATGVGAYVQDMIFDAAGDLWCVGVFTTMNSVADTRNIARWDGTNWNAVYSATYPDGIRVIDLDSEGNIYVGGSFASLDGAGPRLAVYDGSSWATVGSGVNDGEVRGIAIDTAGVVYIGGSFTSVGGGPLAVAYIASLDGATWDDMGGGGDDTVRDLMFAADGELYISGQFTDMSGVSANSAARWNGANWSPLGGGLTKALGGTVTAFLQHQLLDGSFLYSGDFDTAGGLAIADQIALWNGTVWIHAGFSLPAGQVTAALILPNGDEYYGFNTTGTISARSDAQIVTNDGTATVYPKLVIKRTGGTTATIQWVGNATTGHTLYFDYNLQDGETLTIDLAQGARSCVSSLYGNVWRAILQTSDIAGFALLPGDNDLEVFIAETGSPTLTCTIQWQPAHWAADGVAA